MRLYHHEDFSFPFSVKMNPFWDMSVALSVYGLFLKIAVFSRKFSRPIPPEKPQSSRSAPPLLYPSKKLIAFLIICCAATYWKKWIHENTDNGIDLLANAISSIGRNKKWKKHPSNEGEKTEVQPNDRHKKTRLVIGLFCVFQPWVGGSDWRRLLYT